jgi:2-methylisocitrate lyase-like PEP mutase family enzyme
MTQRDKALRLRELHRTERPLVLPNAWDVASARIFEDAGFPAVATTSAGVAYALGYADGERIPRAEMLEMVARIAGAVAVPVTADMEAGYGDVEGTARGVIAAGAVGFNFEDSYEKPGLAAMELHCDGVRRAMAVAEEFGVPLVVNARTDVYLFGTVPEERRLEETIARLRAYAQAGAASVFAPGVRDEETIRALAAAVECPLNILAMAGAPSIARLGELGVARVSVGSGPMRAAMGLMQRIARELRERGTYQLMLEGAMGYAEANGLFRE